MWIDEVALGSIGWLGGLSQVQPTLLVGWATWPELESAWPGSADLATLTSEPILILEVFSAVLCAFWYLHPNIHTKLVELISRRVSPYLFTCIAPFGW